MAIVTEGEYEGNAMIILKRDEDDKYPFQFGLKKAKLVLSAVEEIKAWVAKREASRPSDGLAPPA